MKKDSINAKRTILGILLRATQEDERMTSDMVMGNILLFMLAGHETTAKSLTWCLYALALVSQKIYSYKNNLCYIDWNHLAPLFELQTIWVPPPPLNLKMWLSFRTARSHSLCIINFTNYLIGQKFVGQNFRRTKFAPLIRNFVNFVRRIFVQHVGWMSFIFCSVFWTKTNRKATKTFL